MNLGGPKARGNYALEVIWIIQSHDSEKVTRIAGTSDSPIKIIKVACPIAFSNREMRNNTMLTQATIAQLASASFFYM